MSWLHEDALVIKDDIILATFFLIFLYRTVRTMLLNLFSEWWENISGYLGLLICREKDIKSIMRQQRSHYQIIPYVICSARITNKKNL